MATFTFNCPQCGNLLSGEDEWRGMESECPYCQKNIIIPHITALPNKPKPTPVLLNSDEKTCPLCGKIIKKGAVFCRFCQKNIPTGNNNISGNKKSITITERICGIKAAKNGQYSIGMVLLLAGCSFLLPISGLMYLICFIVLAVTNENHKHDTFIFQYGGLFVTSIMAWIFWIIIFNL